MKYIKDAVNRSINNIRIATTGIITSVLKSNGTVFVQTSDEEELRDAKIILPPGIYALPNNGQAAQVLFNGTSKKVSLIGVEHTSIPEEINPGEIIVYSESGSYILLKEGKILIMGDIEVTGNIKYSGTLTQG
jgi:phage gp45-like